MKRHLAVLFLIVIAGLTWVSAAPTAEDAATPPYSLWTGTFVLSPNVPFVWLRQAPTASASIVGSQIGGVKLTALIPGGTNGMIFEPNNSQWWGFVSDGRIQGWVEIKSLQLYVPPTATIPPTVTVPPTLTPVPPTATPAPPQAANWVVGSQVRVKSNVAFVWLRANASSAGTIIGTYFPRRLFTVQAAASSDGAQFWWQVRDVISAQSGWVEQNALESVSQPTSTVNTDTWKPGDVVRVRAQLPFVWVRSAPASNAGVMATLYAGRNLWISEARRSDGTQNWWRVQVPNTPIVGWVEENALEFVRAS